MADKTLSNISTVDLDLACLKEHNNSMAIRQGFGLPPQCWTHILLNRRIQNRVRNETNLCS